METLGLLTAATPTAALGSNASDTNADGASTWATADFASLLAAGLMPAAQPSVMAATIPAPAEGAQSAALELSQGVRAEHASVLAQAAQGLAKIAKGEKGSDAALALQSPETGLNTTASTDLIEALPGGSSAATLAASAGTRTDPLAAAAFAPEADSLQHAEALPRHEQVETAPAQAHPHIDARIEKPASAQSIAVLDVAAAVDTPEFAPALSQQVVWMVDKDAQVAELRINPPELGPVEVRLQLKGDEAALQFVSAHAEVRNALEASLVRLRESLAQAGIQLGETSVGSESFRDQAHANGGREPSRWQAGREGDGSWSASLPASRLQHGLVDLFA